MNNDALLSLYLDGSLTSEQRAEFERLMLSAPDFAQEVRELETLQTILGAPRELDERSTAFLRSVEDVLAVSVIAAGAASTLGAGLAAVGAQSATTAGAGMGAGATAGATAAQAAATGWVSSLASSMLASATASTGSLLLSATVALATLGGVGTATYIGLQRLAQSPASSAERSVERQTPIARETTADFAPDAAPASTTQANDATSLQADAPPTFSPDNASNLPFAEGDIAQTKPKSREYKAHISGGDVRERYAGAVSEYMRQLQAKEAANDRVGASLVEKSLGALLRQSGDLRLSRTYLSASLSHARALGLAELEAEARAELALLEFAEGKTAQALRGLQEAVDILTTVKSPERDRWQKELEKLSAKVK